MGPQFPPSHYFTMGKIVFKRDKKSQLIAVEYDKNLGWTTSEL